MRGALGDSTRLLIDCSERRAEDGAALESLEIRGLPTMIFLDGSGQEAARIVGCRPAAEILAALKKAGS